MVRRMTLITALAGALAFPAAAHADAFDDVFDDYQRDGRISACRHSERDLRTAKDQVPNDIEQYAPDFPAALEEALEDRARSGCERGSAGGGARTSAAAAAAPGGGTPASPAGGAPAPAAGGATSVASGAGAAATVSSPGTTTTGGVPQPPGTAQAAVPASDGAIVNAAAKTPAKGSDDAPAPLVVLAVLGGLVLLALLLWGLARFFAWDPAWLASTRHAVAEAGWRAGGAWEDFTDWLRRGRAA